MGFNKTKKLKAVRNILNFLHPYFYTFLFMYDDPVKNLSGRLIFKLL